MGLASRNSVAKPRSSDIRKSDVSAQNVGTPNFRTRLSELRVVIKYACYGNYYTRENNIDKAVTIINSLVSYGYWPAFHRRGLKKSWGLSKVFRTVKNSEHKNEVWEITLLATPIMGNKILRRIYIIIHEMLGV